MPFGNVYVEISTPIQEAMKRKSKQFLAQKKAAEYILKNS